MRVEHFTGSIYVRGDDNIRAYRYKPTGRAIVGDAVIIELRYIDDCRNELLSNHGAASFHSFTPLPL